VPFSALQLAAANGQRRPYVRLVLLPTPAAVPFSSKVRPQAPFRSGEALFEAQCFGIRSK